MAFLFKHLSLSGKIVGFKKEEQLEIPAEALREALTNALCHRQLEKYNLTPSIAVYDDRVEIENPGRLPLDLTPATIKSSHASYPYNPLIAEVLYRSSFLESWGSGVSRMVDACKAQGVPEPEYEVNGGFVRIVFRRTTGKTMEKTDEGVNGPVNGGLNGRLNGRLNPTQQKVYDSIAGYPGIKAKDISARHKIQIDTLYKVIRALTEMNLIEHRGSKKTGGYYPVTQK